MTIEECICKNYIPGKTSLREIASQLNTNHHFVQNVLIKHNIPIIRKQSKQKQPKGNTQYRNMISHLRFDVSLEWIIQFDDFEKLKCLNKCITNRDCRFDESKEWYVKYIEKFYSDEQFNKIYHKWVQSGKQFYLKPSVDHIIPRSKGGTNSLENLQFLTWFENRCKNDLSQDEWNLIKFNIKEYFI